MIKKISAFLLMCIMPGIALSGIGGRIDNREVVGWVGGQKPSYIDKNTVNAWNTYPYYNIVLVESGYGTGTGEFISARHILTNSHVIEYDREYDSAGCGYGSWPDCDIHTSDGKTLKARAIFYGGKTVEGYLNAAQDWAVLEITNKNFCSGHYFGYKSPTFNKGETEINNVWRGGFGALRKLEDTDIRLIKDVYIDMLRKKYENMDIAHYLPDKMTRYAYAEAAARKEANTSINLSEYDTFKIDDTEGNYIDWFSAMYEIKTGRSFVKDYLDDYNTLKVVKTCRALKKRGKTNSGYHTCDSWAGDSGSSINNSNNQVILLSRGGERNITSKSVDINMGPVTENIFTPKVIEKLNNANDVCKGKSSLGGTKATKVDNERVVGRECFSSDLPSGAVSGHYIKNGSKKYDCSGDVKCSCAATECGSGYYLYVNIKGYSMGWCYGAKKRCPSGQHLNVIDGYKTDGKCVNDLMNSDDIQEQS